jgi:hypothetical protein
MSGVEELRAHIDRLSSEIDLQKEVLKKLEHEKVIVQRQLNAVLDPVARLPLELSSEIFLQTMPVGLPEPGAYHVPMLLLNICHAWTAIALSTPALWSAIEITFPSAKRFQKLLPLWLHRAGNRPLSVSLRGKLEADAAEIIWRHGQQLKHLEICYDEEERDDDSDEDSDADIDLFGGTRPGPLPLLETLTIRGLADEREYPGLQILELLHLAPNLIECIFQFMDPVDNIGATEAFAEVVLPALRRLMFGGRIEEEPNSDDGILRHLSLPALETLSLLDISGDELVCFLKRSSPPLQELVIRLGTADIVQLVECFHFLPTLLRFEIWRPKASFVVEFLAVLAESPSLLPNLHSLIIHLFQSPIPEFIWETLLRALLARRTQLQLVHVDLFYSSPASFKPTEDILAAFRDLAATGVQIFIGNRKCNFISI